MLYDTMKISIESTTQAKWIINFLKGNLMKIFALMFSIKLPTYIFCINKLAYASFNLKFFILQLKKLTKCIKKLALSMYHGPLKILNLHRKSKYPQNKNIARFLNHLLRALCSYFVDILIFYAKLKFSVSSCWNDCYQFLYFFVISKASFLQFFCI